jgi:hypothetical protein
VPSPEPERGVRLNRYLALGGLGTRRSVERLIATGRVAVDGAAVTDPAARVPPGAQVTLDGADLPLRGPLGVLVRSGPAGIPPLAHPASLHAAGTSARNGCAVLLDDPTLAARLRAAGYDPGRLDDSGLAEPGDFRPLSPAELEAARVFARRSRRP